MYCWQPKSKATYLQTACRVAAALVALGLGSNSLAQKSWYQIELSIFTNEDQTDRAQERWLPGRLPLDHPSRITRLKELADLLLPESMLPDPVPAPSDESERSNEDEIAQEQSPAPTLSPAQIKAQAIASVGPQPKKPGPAFQYFDPQRDALFKLPSARSDFSQTNRAIERSSDHRLLFHAVWQQPVLSENEAISILVEGGENFGPQSELQGNLTIHFNDSEDRVVLAADIWLTEFVAKAPQPKVQTEANAGAEPMPRTQSQQGIEENSESAAKQSRWALPQTPEAIVARATQKLKARRQTEEAEYDVANVFHMLQSRPMRSNEFHYLDHPALGIVVQVQPHEVPALPTDLGVLNDTLEGNDSEVIIEADQPLDTDSPAN